MALYFTQKIYQGQGSWFVPGFPIERPPVSGVTFGVIKIPRRKTVNKRIKIFREKIFVWGAGIRGETLTPDTHLVEVKMKENRREGLIVSKISGPVVSHGRELRQPWPRWNLLLIDSEKGKSTLSSAAKVMQFTVSGHSDKLSTKHQKPIPGEHTYLSEWLSQSDETSGFFRVAYC